jgi:hypothetical protein
VIILNLIKLPLDLQKKIQKFLYQRQKESLEENLKLFTSELRRYFSKHEINQIAYKTKFVQRKSKLDAWQMLKLCSFENSNVAKDTLIELSTKISKNNRKTLSRQGLDQRFNKKCVQFLKSIFQELLTNQISNQIGIESDLSFNRVRILDSTSFQVANEYAESYPGSGGSANTAGVKIQLEYELKSGEVINIKSGPGSGSDNTFANEINDTIEQNDLIIRDLGYFSIDSFKNIEKKEAFYISRLKPNIATYIKNKNVQYYKNGSVKKSSIFQRIDLKDVMKDMEYGTMKEFKEIYVGREEKYKTRLIIYKLTENQLYERQVKTVKSAKKKGITKSQNTLSLLGITMYITNIMPKAYDLQKIYELYTLRWQVELIFKVWKSIYHIDKLKKVKIERFECQLYGKLILALVSSTVLFKVRKLVATNKNKEISEIQLAQVVNEFIHELYISLNRTFEETLEIILLIYDIAHKNTMKQRKKDKKTEFDILEAIYSSQINYMEVEEIA